MSSDEREPPLMMPVTSRRQLLVMVAGSIGASMLSSFDDSVALFSSSNSILPVGTNFDLPFSRTTDMIELVFGFRNVKLVTNGRRRFVEKAKTNTPTYLVVTFPPQHVAEESVLITSEGPDGTAAGETAPADLPEWALGYLSGTDPTRQYHRRLPLRSRFASPTRLVFELRPTSSQRIPYTAAGLLDWTNPAFVPVLVPSADFGSVGYGFTAPLASQTSIEFPYGVVLSPTSNGRWRNRTAPRTRGTRSEVWSTSLDDRPAAGGSPDTSSPASLRAVWTTEDAFDGGAAPPSPNHPNVSSNPGFAVSPNQNERWQLVQQTYAHPERWQLAQQSQAFALGGSDAIRARRFRLSSLGATVDMAGTWPSRNDPQVNLTGYTHRAVGGRDVYVQVVKEGYLYPTGHRASLVQVTERVFATPHGPDGAGTGPVAYLQAKQFIVVVQRTRNYGSNQRHFPLRQVTIEVDSTPTVQLAQVDKITVPRVGQWCYEFPCTVIDQTNTIHQLSIPLVFVESAEKLDEVATTYQNLQTKERTIDTRGQRISFTPEPVAGAEGSTTFPTSSIVMLGPATFVDAPRMELAGIQVQSVGALANATKPFAFRYPKIYLDHGFDPETNPAMLFAQMLEPPAGAGDLFAKLKVEFPDVRSVGGLVKPDFNFAGLSALRGVLGGTWDLTGDVPSVLSDFNPATFFTSLPTILGGLNLGDVLRRIPSPPDTAVPRLSSKVRYRDVAGQRIPNGVDVTYTWCTDNLENTPKDDPVLIVRQGDPDKWVGKVPPVGVKSRLCIEASITTTVDVPTSPNQTGAASSTDMVSRGSINDFQVSLFGTKAQFIVIEFAAITFESRTGAAPQVTPTIRHLHFAGALKFIKALASKMLPEGGKQSQGGMAGAKFVPLLEVSSTHLAWGFKLGLPSLSLGAFSLSNLEIGGLITLPFDAKPMTAQFSVCRPDRPFLLSVGFLGGGGFFIIELGLDGVRRLEISLEFGAVVQLDLGVASGSVALMGGIHFLVSSAPKKLELSGFVRMSGQLKILGLVTLSAQFLLTLSYVEPPGKVSGKAMATFSVEVAFFSKSVTVEVKKEFGGGSTSNQRLAGHQVRADRVELAASMGPPTVADYLSEADWSVYQSAFASP